MKPQSAQQAIAKLSRQQPKPMWAKVLKRLSKYGFPSTVLFRFVRQTHYRTHPNVSLYRHLDENLSSEDNFPHVQPTFAVNFETRVSDPFSGRSAMRSILL